MYQLKSDDSADLNNQLREHIVAFNAAHFNAERIPLGFKFVNEQNSVVAGIHGQVFGNWLLINWLWCDDKTRGKGLATRLLAELESKAKAFGASTAQLDTLDFQAKPFYEKNGYQVKYEMSNYPLDGCRYFMEKSL
ncbi:N-acetyltransferase [Pseudoalteromonas sp. S4488]|uniref:GNAT family N-acetyltransferase n=1 Tax=unclassified Pseudoalteromonas TaxID=194690 RepID=UPI001023F31A|nr:MULTISPECIES: GNAT family N-acetyltransferase [unclassified Pseudoalteromonas]RZF86042.1 N-acetyltransferase [Pseudoalteromonas sp. CO109Y]TMO34045.1 N-acetyltransferase [Pseudoalteromonas sp. S4491]TMO40378.1 N-acetyltransferase [Pseudoalteromonas sp. S4488]